MITWAPVSCERSDELRHSMRPVTSRDVDGAIATDWFDGDAPVLIDYRLPPEGGFVGCSHVAPVRCVECSEPIDDADVHAGYGLCGSCLHNAVRSGWEPGS